MVLFSGITDPARCAPRGQLVEVITAADLRGLAPDPVISAAVEILRAGARDAQQAFGLG
jgi:hypothetical protein